MSLPSFSELRKSLTDLFTKGYHFGEIKISTKTATCTDVQVETDTYYKFEDTTLVSDIHAKINEPTYGLTSCTKWTTANIISQEVTCSNYLACGMKVGTKLVYDLNNGKSTPELISQYKLNNATLDLKMHAGFGGGEDSKLGIEAGLVAGYKGFITGWDGSFDTVEGTLKKNNFVLGFLGPKYYAMLNLDKLETVTGCFYQEVTPNLQFGIHGSAKGEAEEAPEGEDLAPPTGNGEDQEAGVPGSSANVAADAAAAPPPDAAAAPAAGGGGGGGGATLAIGAKYALDPKVNIRAKVSNLGELGVGCDLKVTDNATLFVSGHIDLKAFSTGPHKVGLGLEFM